MKNTKINIKSLHVKVSLSVATAALLVMVISSYFFYKRSYEKSYIDSEHSIHQLLETVSVTASIAAYVDNKEIAQEVVTGLSKNDIVISAQIISHNQIIGAQSKKTSSGDDGKISLTLKDPFDNNETVGEISIIPNQLLIANRARASALETTIGLATQGAVVALLVLILVYWMMTKPLSRVSRTLHKIIPGDGKRLNLESDHRGDEIGLLVDDINLLLQTVDKMLEEERQLRHRVEILEHRFRGIFEDSSAGIFLVQENGRLVTANPAFFKLIDRNINIDKLPNDNNIIKDVFLEPDQARSLIKLALISKRPSSWDLQIVCGTGEEVRWVHCIFSPVGENQEMSIVEGVMYDITQRKISEDRNRELAEKDTLTGLANRQFAEVSIKELVSSKSHFALMLIDLDRFKYINDSYGHDAGDWVLKTIADRLSTRVRSSDVVSRLGGDEFLIIIKQTENVDRIKNIAQKILEDQQQKIEVQPGFFEAVGISIGISFFSTQHDNELSVRKHADQAMYTVKRHGKNGYAIYNSTDDYEIFHLKK